MSERGEKGGPSWKPIDYILTSQPAAPDVVAAEFARTISHLGVSRGVLVPLNSVSVYASMITLAIDQQTTMAPAHSDSGPGTFHSWREWAFAYRSAISSRSKRKVTRLLRDVYPYDPMDWVGRSSMVLYESRDWRADLAIAVVTESNRVAEVSEIDALAATLAATTPVIARTADRQNADIERMIADYEVGAVRQPMAPLLNLAIRATDSAWGAVYSPVGKVLVPLEVAPEGGAPVFPEVSVRSMNLVARAYEQQLSFIRGPENAGLRPLGSEFPGPQIAAPLRLTDPDNGGVGGVLIVGRDDIVEAHPYTQYESALVRNVALRIASQVELAFVRDALQLFRDVELSRSPTEPSVGIPPSGASAPEDTTPWVIDHDLLATRDVLSSVVDRLSLHPHIGSASVRLVTCDRRNLQRVAIAPHERQHDTDARISVNSPMSVNALTYRSRRPILIGNLDKSEDLHELGLSGVVRPTSESGGPARRSKSELCLPLVVHGNAIGTLNVESPLKDGVTAVRPVADVLAALIVGEMARIQRQFERHIVDTSNRLFGAAHALAGVSDDLLRDEPFEASELASHAETIRQSLNLVGEHPTGLRGRRRTSSQPLDAHDLLEGVVSSVQDSSRKRAVRISQIPTRREARLSQSGAQAVYIALREVLTNALRRVPANELGVRQVDLIATRFDEEMLRVDVTNRLPKGLTVPIGYLYSVPIVEGNRLHLGALAARSILRSVGADVFVADITDDHIRVRILVPLEGGTA